MLIKNIKNDILLGFGILVLALITLVVWKTTRTEGNFVNVVVDGKVTETYDLHEDNMRIIFTDNGNNVLVIDEGEVYIKSADCPDKICVNHKKISKAGETIVCLPHKLVIEITENEEND
jgi:hypothetical protein